MEEVIEEEEVEEMKSYDLNKKIGNLNCKLWIFLILLYVDFKIK